MIRKRSCRVLFALAAALVAAPGAAAAQSGWTAQLVVSPLPSPYLSDWEIDPTIGELIVTNSSGTTTDATLHYTLTWNGRLLLRGTTDPQTIPAGESVTFNANSDVGGQADWDRDFQDLVARTGRLPEGEYEGCATITDPGGFVLVERQCIRFATLYPDPPHLVFPFDRDTVTTQDPIFEWQPVQLPALEDLRVGYVLAIAEVNTAGGQHPEVALESNILHYLEPDLTETHHQYPIGGLPLVSGRTYAWRVQALDGDGRPVAANQGRSEVWTFVYREPEADVERRVATIELTPRRDTLRYAGDTSRFEVKAFDEDNVEIPGARFQWRSADTTIARVDSTGVVTGVGSGETQIVASVDGVVDSAFSVTTTPSGLVGRFELYAPEETSSSLLELLQSGSFEEVVPRLIERLQSGDFRMPIPMIAALRGGNNGGGAAPGDGESPHGPNAELTGGRSPSADDECSQLSFGFGYAVDYAKKTFVLQFSLPKSQAAVVASSCVGVSEQSVAIAEDKPPGPPGEKPPGPPGEKPPGPPGEKPPAGPAPPSPVSFMLVWNAEVPGLPRLALAWRWGGLIDFPDTELEAGYIVVAWRSMTIDKDLLPHKYAGFFGNASFDAGVGVTFYIKRRCVKTEKWFCQVLTTLYPNQDKPEFTVHGFAGVTASETSAAYGSASLRGGTSLALGFSIQISGPVIRVSEEEGGFAMQFGVLIAGQDSLVAFEPGTSRHNFSLGLAPTVTLTWGRRWEFTLSVGMEFPGPKLVVFGQLPVVWQASVIRVGNPTVVFTYSPRRAAGPVKYELAVSGTWGVGEHRALGLSDDCGEGAVRGDIGGASGCGGLGRATFVLTWTRMGGDLKQATDSLAYWRRVARERKAEADDDEDDDPRLREANRRVLEWSLSERSAKGRSAKEACGGKVVRELCRTWTVRGSIGNGSLVDLLAFLVRAIPGVP